MATVFTIEPASSDDLPEVRSLFEAYARSLDIDLGYQHFDVELRELPGVYVPPRGALLIARSEERTAIGCAALRPTALAHRAEMKRLYVTNGGRAYGVGRALATRIIGLAREAGYRELVLDTLASMTAAQSLYRGLGFEPTEPYYDTPVAGTVFMRLTL